MEAEKGIRGGYLKSRRFRIFLGLFCFIAILAIVIPPAVVITLRKKARSMGPKSTVFVPLYVYPAPGAWSPLEDVIKRYPELNFTIVINPGSGPGPNPLPDANYTREIPLLRRFDNVRLLGYVATTYANRDIALVREDVETYAAWPARSANGSLAVNGIFFDETPQAFDENALAYYQELTSLVKQSKGLGPDNTVVHNPGAVPDPRYLSTADTTVIFEDTYDTFLHRNDQKVFSKVANGNRNALCAIIHSVPTDIGDSDLRSLVKEARKVADEVFITLKKEDYYAGFGPKWDAFVDLMDQ
ncbi:hypothetical protein VTN49DRAFT_6022 [Thermomyces lanuginosus]|uniref:uncharacterized protein n=1 Tax=Thermomyces lanuginosus TaxID=5541 RepID=UPI003743FBE9